MIELLSSLIRIPSFSRDEREACDCLELWMHAHGLTPWRKGNNLWIENRPAEPGLPTILLNAHIDTVRPAASYTRDPFAPAIEGDRLYGLGSNDDGGSLVTLLQTYIQRYHQVPYRLIFSATAEEEVCGQGGLDLVKDDWGQVDLGIIGEPTRLQIAVAERGLLVLDCTAHGVSGHAARNEGVNALYKAIDDINWFRTYRFPKVSEYLGEVKMSVTMIDAGTQHNVVPDTCHFVVDVRSNGCYTNAELVDLIRSQVSCDVQPRSTRLNASHIEASHPIVQWAKKEGITLFGSPTTSNQTLLTFPTIKVGPGDSARSHSADEYIYLSEIDDAVRFYTHLLDALTTIYTI